MLQDEAQQTFILKANTMMLTAGPKGLSPLEKGVLACSLSKEIYFIEVGYS